MNIFLAIVWFISYLCAWFSFVYFGWLWSHGVATAQASAFWLFMSVVLGVIGGYIAVRLQSQLD